MKSYVKVRGWTTTGEAVEVWGHLVRVKPGVRLYELRSAAGEYVSLSDDGRLLWFNSLPKYI